MALVVEDGTGKSDAESYVSVTDCDTRLALFTTPTSWTSATTAQKEVALRKAARYIDIVYGWRFKGARRLVTQSLQFPRSGLVTRDGYSLVATAVPTGVVNACVDMAAKAIDEDILPDLSVGSGSVISKERNKIDTIEEDIEYVGGKNIHKVYSKIEGYLMDYLEESNRVWRS